MCTTIAGKCPASGSAKGPGGWFHLDQVYVGYDHPVHAPLDHALSLDFVSENTGPGARVGVELTRESARALATRILETLDAADRYEQGT
jgi:hypothetical protein